MLDNTYFRELKPFYSPCEPAKPGAPNLVYFNDTLASDLDLLISSDPAERAMLFAGAKLLAGSEPIAQIYAGHQFGHFNPQLGDGRAVVLGEIVTPAGNRYDLALKGSGRTPFSRNGDGRAGLGPVLREVLLAEAMHALNVPTTRSLAAVETGETVYRQYAQKGAVLTRVAASHIRVGTFEYFAARGEYERVKQLADYTIARHYPELAMHDQPYLALLDAVMQRQAELVAKWMGLGFIHGVMNTDNVSIAGETIDYGPCAFIESYNPGTVFSSIDHAGRYSYDNQPSIMQWNMARFAETLLPLLDDNPEQANKVATESVHYFSARYEQAWLKKVCEKLGLADKQRGSHLIGGWLNLLEQQKVDFTLAWSYLCDAATGEDAQLIGLFKDQDRINQWLSDWHSLLPSVKRDVLANNMREHSPRVVARNHQVEVALSSAEEGDIQPFYRLLSVLQNPYDAELETTDYFKPAARSFTDGYQTFCGT